MKRFGILLASVTLGAALSGAAAAMGGGFGGGHMGGGFGGGHMGGFAGRSMAMGGFNRGFRFNRGFDHRFARFDHFHRFNRFNRFNHFNHFNRFRNRFDFFPFVAGGVYGDCGFWGDSWGNWGNPYCGYGYPDYANGYGYPDYAYSYPDYGYPATGSSGYYAAAPLVTGRSVAAGQQGSYCTISVKACELHHGGACSCPGRAPVAH